MAGVGRTPKDVGERIGHEEPLRGEWQAAPGVGWQHGPVPPCPARSKAAQDAWATWFGSWFAAHWTPDDLPNLRLCVKAWARADAADARAADQLAYVRLGDAVGVTRKGQQDRRWKPPVTAPVTGEQSADDFDPRSEYGHLRVVNE